jgi:hypothetical protein
MAGGTKENHENLSEHSCLWVEIWNRYLPNTKSVKHSIATFGS